MRKNILVFILLVLAVSALAQGPQAVIPKPASVHLTDGTYTYSGAPEVKVKYVKDKYAEEAYELAEKLGIKLGDFMMPVRMAVTGSKVSPPLIGSILVLGKERSLARIEKTLATL